MPEYQAVPDGPTKFRVVRRVAYRPRELGVSSLDLGRSCTACGFFQGYLRKSGDSMRRTVERKSIKVRGRHRKVLVVRNRSRKIRDVSDGSRSFHSRGGAA